MNFRPTLFQFESRENPSVPVIDPIATGGIVPSSTAPALTTTTPPTTTTVIVTPTTTTTDPLLVINTIYNVPLVP